MNQYTSVGGISYSYDNNGNLTDDGTYKYYYDCENRLTDVNDVNDVAIASYEYDSAGRRVKKIVYGSPDLTTKYGYDGGQVIAEYDGSDTLLRKFIYGPGVDEPISMVDVAGGNAVYYYHLDGLGAVVALSNVNNEIVERYSYDVFGEPTIRDANDDIISDSNYSNPYMFTARRYDAETGLYYYRARYYAPHIGRFLQPDPIGYAAGLNVYIYCSNNPIVFSDPWGLCKEGTLWNGEFDWLDWIAYYGGGFLRGADHGMALTSNGMTFGQVSSWNTYANRLKRRNYQTVGTISEVCGGTSGIALGAVARHLAEASFWVLTRNEDYKEPEVKLVSSMAV